MDLGLGGKRALITGGSAGIGLGIARGLIAEGAAVAICGRDPDRLESAVSDLRGGGTAYGFTTDVTDPAALARTVQAGADAFGGLDLVVANAGGSTGGDLLDSTPEDWADTFAINVLHAANLIRAATPHLERGGGAALIIASITGWKVGPKSSYGAAKAAEIHLAAALGAELGPRGIRVNALSPGSVLFPGGGWARFGEANPEGLAEFARADFPAGRLVALEEVVDAACFLLSARAGGINGADIHVDGGQDHPSVRRYFP
ncbi:MAG TPA: SDR family oxidoreductase [Streptosporangiaceae bacterium]|jgi:3-oxoacyl-[acyl-carrier protein] reductase